MIPERQIELIGSRGVHAAADTLVASHAQYPAFRHVFADRTRRVRALRPFFEATIRDAIPFGWVVAARSAGEILGVAVWLPPRTFPWSARRKLRATMSFLRVLAAAPGAFPTFVEYGANTEAAHPSDDHWYLVVLGVRPEAQGHGWGDALLRPVLDHADNLDDDCYLETSDRRNVGFYQRFGFHVEDDALALVPAGPTHVSMRRHPHC